MPECTSGETRIGDNGQLEKCIGGVWVIMPGPAIDSGTGVSARLVTDMTQLTAGEIQKAVASSTKNVYLVIQEVPEAAKTNG